MREGFAAFARACETLCGEDDILRMKAPSTLTMRWLLACLSRFRHLQPGNEVQLTSAWMDVDHVDFNQEPFDCAVLLSDGVFPADWEVRKLFPELLIPVGAPDLLGEKPWGVSRLAGIELLHPRWTSATGVTGCSAWASLARYRSRVGRFSTRWS